LLKRTGLLIDELVLEPRPELELLVLLPAPYVLELLLPGVPLEFEPDLPLLDFVLSWSFCATA